MNLGKAAFKGTFFVAANTYLNLAINFATGIILRRFFIPVEFFGLDSLARFFLELFGRAREFGFELAAVHRQTEINRVFSTFFVLQLVIGLLNQLLIILFYPILSSLYPQQPLLPLLVFVYGFFAIVKGLYLVQKTYLEKHLLFKYVGIFDVLSLILASSLGILTAYLNWGIWSLVVLNNAYILFNFIFVWLKSEWQWEWAFDKEIAKWFFKFGFFLWIGALTTFILYKYNDFVIGTILGLSALGYYTTALAYAQMPTSMVTSIVSRVAFPTYASLQNEREKLEFTFNFVLKNIIRFSLPISLIMFLTADDFIVLLLGDKWLPVVPIFKFLVVYSLIKPIFEDTGAFLAAIGKPKIVSFYISIQAGLLLVIAPVVTTLFGVYGSALGLGLTMLIGVALAYYYTSRYIRIYYWQNFGKAFLISLLVIVLFTALDSLLISKLMIGLTGFVASFEKLALKLVIILVLYAALFVSLDLYGLKADYRYLREILKK